MKITIRQLKQLIREAAFKDPVKLPTSGKGYWTDQKRSATTGARITKLVLVKQTFNDPAFDEELAHEFGLDDDPPELRAYFTNWNVHKHGLIYTDPLFIREFRKILLTLGFSQKAIKSVDYSEQGMQGRNYVSFDVDKTFIQEWDDLVGERSIEL